MLKLLKYMKKSIVPIIAIVALLFVQAICDLSLPDYTSNIVNVGIQQGGVENATPDIIRKSEFEKILLFVDADKRQLVSDNYTVIRKESLSQKDYESYLKKYPALKQEELYKLNEVKDETLSSLNSALAKPELIVYKLSEEGPETKEMTAKMLAGMKKGAIPEGTKLFDVLKMMPQQQVDVMTVEINKQFDKMPESLIEQTAVVYVRGEYAAIGMDVNKMQATYIFVAGLKMLGLALISMAAAVVVALLSSRIAALLGMDLRGKVFNKVVGFSSREFDKFSTASLITRSTNDIQQIQLVMVMMFKIVIYAPIIGIGGIIKVLQTNTSMVWIIGLTIAVVFGIMGTLFAFAMPRFKIVQKLVDKLNLVTREILIGLSVIRAFSTEKYEEKRFDEANKDLTKINLFVNRIMTFMMPVMMLIMNCVTVLIVWVGAKNIDLGTMQVGNLMAFIQYTMQIVMAFIMISMMSIMLPRASVSATRIVEVIDTDSMINDPKTPKEFNTDKKGYVEFQNVSFRYPQAEEDVLSDITFTARPGETTAIIGSTGSGKSTLINLIPRFFDVTGGTLFVNGADVREVTQHDLRAKLGFVPQKGVLFSGTIESNIKYGAQDASDEQMNKAARIAQATDFIEEKTEKYDSEISQGGSNVSGGQKQRLAIARAIATNPDIYVFDDSFSALDYRTDVALRNALKSETKESTVIIIAQRISTILQADQIVVLDEGKVVGIGTHKELLKNCEVYSQIASSQLSKEELDNE
ncbi:MAG: ABC transporter ATP-binding protein [Oscillospiraceae bacterium]